MVSHSPRHGNESHVEPDVGRGEEKLMCVVKIRTKTEPTLSQWHVKQLEKTHVLPWTTIYLYMSVQTAAPPVEALKSEGLPAFGHQ